MVRDLRRALVGRSLRDVRTGHPQVFRYPSAEAVVAGVEGTRVVAVGRSGKYIVCRLDTGDDLVVHLGMTGHLLVCDAAAPVAPHTHLRARMDDGRELRFDDARRFGRILLGTVESLAEAGAMPWLGVDPLGAGFTPAALDAVLRCTTRTVKAALLDQTGVAGLGNIYIDEACFRGRVRPGRRCHRLTRAERTALFAAITAVLEKAIANRGSSIDDYRDVWNARGSHQEQLQVYGRAGRPCLACGTRLRRTVIAARTTVYCPLCQR